MSGPVSEVKLNIETKTITNDLQEDLDDEEEEDIENVTIDIDQEINGGDNINENKEITSKLQSMAYSKIDVDIHFHDTTNNIDCIEMNIKDGKKDKSLSNKKENEVKDLHSLKSPSTSKLNKNPSTNRLGNLFISTDRSINIKNVSKQVNENITILTKITEQFKHSLDSNKKIPIYDYLVHDEYINRFANKGKNDNWKKINNFINRNEEFKGKKQLKLHGKTEKKRQDLLKNCHGKPNKKDINNDEIRTPNDFINNQIEYAKKRESNLLDLKNIHIEKYNQNVRNTPFITSRSRAMAEKRNKSREAEIHKRLYSEKLNKSKTHNIVNEGRKGLIKNKSVQELYPSSKNINTLKRTKSEILIESEKLHSESKKKSLRIQENERIKILEVKKLEKEEFMSKPSKILILTNFIKSYEASLLRIFNAKYSVYLTFEDFSRVLYDIHFILNDPKESSNSNQNSIKKNEENKALRDAWKFINSNDESVQSVNSNKILVFLCAVMGLYKGENDENEKKESDFTLNKEIKTKQTHHSRKGSTKIESPKEEERDDSNLLKNILHNVDIDQYTYSKLVAKHLKICFRFFCENRINYILDENDRNYKTKQKHFTDKGVLTKPVISPTSINVANQFRKKLIEKIESDNITPQVTKRKINLEEAYVIQRKKKEQELAKKRQQKDEELMKKCTFQPNAYKRAKSPSSNSNTSEITNKLYFDAFFRTNKKDTIKNDDSFKNDECTFSPKLNSYKSSIFTKNPLKNDNFVKKSMETKERVRIEKKICDIQKKKGINNLRNLKNIEDMLKEEHLPDFIFSLEAKRDKDTFDSYRKSFNPISLKTPSKEITETLKSSQYPLLYLDINIDNNKFEKMEIYEKDDPVLLAESFATKYLLNEEKRIFLQKLIEEKMKENLLKR